MIPVILMILWLNLIQAGAASTPEPTSFRQSQQHSDADQWQKACEEEMEAQRLNGTWEIVKLPLRVLSFTPVTSQPSLALLECSKGLRLSLQQVNCLEVREVINEGVIPLMCGHLDRPCTSLWTSWRGFKALEDEGEKGSACIFPALQASHTGSGSACESSLKPVTRLSDCSFLMPAK